MPVEALALSTYVTYLRHSFGICGPSQNDYRLKEGALDLTFQALSPRCRHFLTPELELFPCSRVVRVDGPSLS